MARATTKKELLEMADEQYKKMWQLINSMSDKEQITNFNYSAETIGKEAHWKRDKNIKDILIHLFEWHQLLLNWVDNNIKGIEKQFLLEPYNWKTYGDMNVEFWKKHQNTSYEKSKKMVDDSHKAVIDLIEKFSNDELFSKGYFKWTSGSTLGQYCVSVTACHYDWAIKKLKVHIKTLK